MLAPAGATQIDASPIDLLEYYNLREYEPVRSALTRAAGGDLGIILDAWKGEAEKWIEADGAESSARRRLVVATVALEVGRAALDQQWQRSKEIIEWTCALWRKQRIRTTGERLFHLAALALIEGARDIEAMDEHAAHVKERFPDEPRLLLAHAFRQEIAFWDQRLNPGLNEEAGPVIKLLLRAQQRPGNQREASLRLGLYTLRLRQYDHALTFLRDVPPGDDDGQMYLVQLFSGWAYEGLQKMDDAVRSFKAALDVIPAAQSASLSLAARLHARGERAEAHAIVESMLAADPAAPDPWRIFGYGDLRRFPLLVDGLRRELR
jgi:tetratricopeptide (TPR) repeat protein